MSEIEAVVVAGSSGVSNAPPQSDESKALDKENGARLFGQGKRDLACGELQKSVDSLQESSRLYAKLYGEMGDECASVYYWYGKALLELARIETGVLGNALTGVPDESDAENTSQIGNPDDMEENTVAKVIEDVKNALEEPVQKEEEDKPESTAENEAETTTNTTNTTDTAASTDTETKPAAVTDETDSTTEAEAKPVTGEEGDKKEEGEKTEDDDEEADDEDGGGDDDDDGIEGDAEDKPAGAEADGEETTEVEKDGDDVSTIQLSFEMLDLAKVILLRKPNDKECQLQLSQVHLVLGENSLESEQYARAVEDFKSCMEIQKEHLDVDDRKIAETHYQLGLAYMYDKQCDPAIESYTNGINVLVNRIATQNKLIAQKTEDGQGDDADKDAIEMIKKEVIEITALLPEINGKIADVKEMKNSAVIPTEDVDGTPSNQVTSSTSDTTAAVSDITHLVRKKRKTDEGKGTESESKKPRADNETAVIDTTTPTPVVTDDTNNTTINGSMNGTHKNDVEKQNTEPTKELIKEVSKKTEEVATNPAVTEAMETES